jgi:hypothetical protein
MASGFTFAGLSWWNVARRSAVAVAAVPAPLSSSSSARLRSNVGNANVSSVRNAANLFIIIRDDRDVASWLAPDQSKQNRLADAVADVTN